MTDTWQPAVDLRGDRARSTPDADFTPSYVHARLRRQPASSRRRTDTFGPYGSNGYEAEWRELAEIVRGERAGADHRAADRGSAIRDRRSPMPPPTCPPPAARRGVGMSALTVTAAAGTSSS